MKFEGKMYQTTFQPYDGDISVRQRHTFTLIKPKDSKKSNCDTTLKQLEKDGKIPSKEKFRLLPCNTFIMSGACPYHDRCVFLHDQRLKIEGVRARPARSSKTPQAPKDAFYWPDMLIEEVSQRLDNRGLPSVEQNFEIAPFYGTPTSSINDRACYSMWMHFTEFCHVSSRQPFKAVQMEPFFEKNIYLGKTRLQCFQKLAKGYSLSQKYQQHQQVSSEKTNNTSTTNILPSSSTSSSTSSEYYPEEELYSSIAECVLSNDTNDYLFEKSDNDYLQPQLQLQHAKNNHLQRNNSNNYLYDSFPSFNPSSTSTSSTTNQFSKNKESKYHSNFNSNTNTNIKPTSSLSSLFTTHYYHHNLSNQIQPPKYYPNYTSLDVLTGAAVISDEYEHDYEYEHPNAHQYAYAYTSTSPSSFTSSSSSDYMEPESVLSLLRCEDNYGAANACYGYGSSSMEDWDQSQEYFDDTSSNSNEIDLPY